MIKGIGIDIVEVKRFEGIKNNTEFIDQILTKPEKIIFSRCRSAAVHLAKVFAIKEAVMKSLGIGLHFGTFWHDVEVSERWEIAINCNLKLFAAKLKYSKVYSSFSQSKNYVTALILME
jgi:holo-[acyl-carrier protein] synthase